MLQLVQNLSNGQTEKIEAPTPALTAGRLLIRTSASLISAGTERMLLEFGKANWLNKARQQPDKLRVVLDKARTDGLMATWESVQSKLEQPLPLGYSNVGVVLEVGRGVSGFAPGDRVVSNGPHAELVSVPRNLCARIPDEVADEAAVFTVLGAIALQGIRLAEPVLGECIAVSGLGLLGLITVQLLRAQGCRVLGIDFDPNKCALARQFGAETVTLSEGHDPVAAAELFSRGRGMDAVIIAAATRSSDPVHQAALMSRKRGRIVLVGVTGLELSRDDFYKKELRFQVSCSYGPGRYDEAYEAGADYPAAFVRWTAQRNFEAVLDLLASERLDVAPLVTHRFPISDADRAYELLESQTPHLGVIFEYPSRLPDTGVVTPRTVKVAPEGAGGAGTCAFIGAGNYATRTLIPAFKKAGANLHTVVSAGGLSAACAGRKFAFSYASSDAESVLSGHGVDTVVIATRHDTHARYVVAAIEAGKNVFVEKPLAVSRDELAAIEHAHRAARDARRGGLLMVGFNRRFAPHVVKMKELLHGCAGPKGIVITVNAGAIPADHWTQDPQAGAGRIIGEACHFVDLARFLTGSAIVSARSEPMQAARSTSGLPDTATLHFTYADGSIATVHYFANGHKAFPKERVEVFAAGRILQLDNYRRLRAWGFPGFRSMNLWTQQKGAPEMAEAFLHAIRTGKSSPIPFDELLEVSRATLDVAAL